MPRHVRTYSPRHRAGCRIDHGDVKAKLTRDCGEFQPYETRSDDNGAFTAFGYRQFDTIGIIKGSEPQNSIEPGSADGKFTAAGTGGEHEPVIGDRIAVIEQDNAGAPIDGDSTCLDALNPVFDEKNVRPEDEILNYRLSQQVIFRERRALIRQSWFVPDQRDAALESKLAEGRCELKPAMPRPDDDDPFRHICRSGSRTRSPSNSLVILI